MAHWRCRMPGAFWYCVQRLGWTCRLCLRKGCRWCRGSGPTTITLQPPDLRPARRSRDSLRWLSSACRAARDHARALLAEAASVTDGPLVLDGQKTDGVDSMLKALKQRAEVSGVVSMAHGKLIVVQGADLTDWQARPQETPEGFVTAAGAFSADWGGPGVGASGGGLAAQDGAAGWLIWGRGWGYFVPRNSGAGKCF